MSSNKRFYWFKLSKDFFKDRRIKKLRKLAGGDTFTIIYQKLLICSLENNGVYEVEDFENIYEAIALDIDEDEDNVHVTLEYLLSCGLAYEHNERKIELSDIKNLTGSETGSARRMRKLRELKKGASHCDTQVTSMLQSSDDRVESIEYRDESIEYRESIKDNTLSQEQYDSLIKEYGKTLVDEKIANASNYKNCMKYEKIKEWCEVDKNKTPKKSTNKFNNFKQREYSKEEMEELEKEFFN